MISLLNETGGQRGLCILPIQHVLRHQHTALWRCAIWPLNAMAWDASPNSRSPRSTSASVPDASEDPQPDHGEHELQEHRGGASAVFPASDTTVTTFFSKHFSLLIHLTSCFCTTLLLLTLSFAHTIISSFVITLSPAEMYASSVIWTCLLHIVSHTKRSERHL